MISLSEKPAVAKETAKWNQNGEHGHQSKGPAKVLLLKMYGAIKLFEMLKS